MCTSLTMTTLDEHLLAGRTMDFPVKGNWHPVLVADRFYNTPLAGKRTIKYPFIGGGQLIDNHDLLVADGVNTQGLSCAELMFPLKASYHQAPVDNQLNLTPQDFLSWVLAEHQSISEVLTNLPDIAIIGQKWLSGNEIYSFHWLLADKTGRTVIIEPLDHQLVVTTDNIGVLTNSPTYPEHIKNLKNQLDVSTNDSTEWQAVARKYVVNNHVPQPTNTPTTRFVYAAINKLGTAKPADSELATIFLNQILSEVAIPFKPTMNDHPNFNFTHYISEWDCTSLTYQFTDCQSQTPMIHSLADVLDQEPHTTHFLL
ncbi:linear amide C-N hydrolase [Lentilactobacillus sp. SPB1-3]|uniref:Linear amide C-N hydrolase n=1 Tax=Lentilactobacillus terminaliae TaxID=3003483 RepID=A0ACD5DFQ8_9LACO|nr:linear amide C-N hydrolase [Lentilactobacillus sp. SPB1-3]MCZ0976574.1 linear amide C-N hydrolase [Lentilactobacillus sp. SPB1-3]